jgi:hypothetical protein
VAVEIEIDPTLGAAAFFAFQHPDVKLTCLIEVVNWKRQVK